jgi:16S rRNA (cytosine1402-N4)-methyltransferase
MTEASYHIPVLLHKSVEALAIQAGGRYVDLTFGGGGHSTLILEQLGPEGKLIAFDQDPDARANAEKLSDPRFQFIHANFGSLHRYLKFHKLLPVDGILADLGISSHQVDETSRGFSFHGSAPLDMRMSQSGERSAAEIVNTAEEAELKQLFRQYGELHNAHKVAAAIVRERENAAIETTEQLVAILQPLAPKFKEYKYYSQAFQALRIEVNQELEVLKQMLVQSAQVLKPGGRLAILSYHSLEDRLVKHYLRAGNFTGEIEKDFYGVPQRPFKPLQGKAIVPDDAEIATNKRARSARLRIAERTDFENPNQQ